MNDNEFIELIAETWVKHGGDSEGLDYLYSQLRERIEEILKEVYDDDQ